MFSDVLANLWLIDLDQRHAVVAYRRTFPTFAEHWRNAVSNGVIASLYWRRTVSRDGLCLCYRHYRVLRSFLLPRSVVFDVSILVILRGYSREIEIFSCFRRKAPARRI